MIRAQLDLTRRIKNDERLLPPPTLLAVPNPLQNLFQLVLEPIHVRLEVLQAEEHAPVGAEVVRLHCVRQGDERRDGEGRRVWWTGGGGIEVDDDYWTLESCEELGEGGGSVDGSEIEGMRRRGLPGIIHNSKLTSHFLAVLLLSLRTA